MRPRNRQSRRRLAWFFSKLIVSAFVTITVLGCARVQHLADARVTHYQMDERATDPGVEDLIAPYKSVYASQMSEVLGMCAEPLYKGSPEGTLGNWLADLLVERARDLSEGHVDFAVQNSGGIRLRSLPAGPITLGKVYEVMPFDNTVVVMELDGVTLKQFLDHMASVNGWPVSAELRYEIAGDRAQNVTISGSPLDDDWTYRVAMPDYIANGGGGCEFLVEEERTTFNYLIRDAIVQKIRELTEQGMMITAQLDGRVTVVQ